MCEFNDFRVQRRLIDGIKEHSIKIWEDQLVLDGLIREIIFKSTKLKDTHSLKELMQYDCKMH